MNNYRVEFGDVWSITAPIVNVKCIAADSAKEAVEKAKAIIASVSDEIAQYIKGKNIVTNVYQNSKITMCQPFITVDEKRG